MDRHQAHNKYYLYILYVQNSARWQRWRFGHGDRDVDIHLHVSYFCQLVFENLETEKYKFLCINNKITNYVTQRYRWFLQCSLSPTHSSRGASTISASNTKQNQINMFYTNENRIVKQSTHRKAFIKFLWCHRGRTIPFLFFFPVSLRNDKRTHITNIYIYCSVCECAAICDWNEMRWQLLLTGRTNWFIRGFLSRIYFVSCFRLIVVSEMKICQMTDMNAQYSWCAIV